jgi:hypothetical protein
MKVPRQRAGEMGEESQAKREVVDKHSTALDTSNARMNSCVYQVEPHAFVGELYGKPMGMLLGGLGFDP